MPFRLTKKDEASPGSSVGVRGLFINNGSRALTSGELDMKNDRFRVTTGIRTGMRHFRLTGSTEFARDLCAGGEQVHVSSTNSSRQASRPAIIHDVASYVGACGRMPIIAGSNGVDCRAKPAAARIAFGIDGSTSLLRLVSNRPSDKTRFSRCATRGTCRKPVLTSPSRSRRPLLHCHSCRQLCELSVALYCWPSELARLLFPVLYSPD